MKEKKNSIKEYEGICKDMFDDVSARTALYMLAGACGNAPTQEARIALVNVYIHKFEGQKII